MDNSNKQCKLTLYHQKPCKFTIIIQPLKLSAGPTSTMLRHVLGQAKEV